MFKNEKAIWPSIIQQPVNADSRRIGVKSARPGVDCRSTSKELECSLTLASVSPRTQQTTWILKEPCPISPHQEQIHADKLGVSN